MELLLGVGDPFFVLSWDLDELINRCHFLPLILARLSMKDDHHQFVISLVDVFLDLKFSKSTLGLKSPASSTKLTDLVSNRTNTIKE